jgi:hypothetical protein
MRCVIHSRGVNGEPALQWAAGFTDVRGLHKRIRGYVRNHFVPNHFLPLLLAFYVNNELLAVPLGTGLWRRGKHLTSRWKDVDAPHVLQALGLVPPQNAETKKLSGGSF